MDHSFGFQTTAAYSLEPGETYINIDAGLRFGVLPVTWVSIEAKHRGDHNWVSWKTAFEVNTDRFEVERSFNTGEKFELICEVDATGESVVIVSYEFKDEDVRLGTYYLQN